MEDTKSRNIRDLMNAANTKLKEQQEEMESTENQDIYAEMRREMESDPSYPDNVEIAYSPQGQDAPVIQYEPDFSEGTGAPETDAYMENAGNAVFPGGPPYAQIEIWKKQFSREKVLHTQVLEKHFIFRTLNRYEYKQIVAIENVDALYREEMICRTCVLFPYNYDFKDMAQDDAGYPSTLAQIIMENSGFTKEYGIEVL